MAIFASTLILGFASCSDDDKNEEFTNGKMLPSKITIMEGNEIYAGYILTYNEKNQLIKYTDTTLPEEGDRPFEYDEEGRLVSFDDGDSYPKRWTFTDKKTIEFTTGGDSEGRDNATIKLNDKGLMSEFKGKDSKLVELYTYDTDNNLLTVSYGDELTTCTYHKEFSPFCNTTIPSYFMLWDDNWGIQTTGKHMMKSISPNTSDAYDETVEYSILDSKDNYPTKIEEKATYIDNKGEKETTIHTYIIEYQAMK